MKTQPPSGGCVLKQPMPPLPRHAGRPAAFGRLCVETSVGLGLSLITGTQPPSGGCVLKLLYRLKQNQGN